MANTERIEKVLNNISAMAEFLNENEIDEINKVIQRAIVRMGTE